MSSRPYPGRPGPVAARPDRSGHASAPRRWRRRLGVVAVGTLALAGGGIAVAAWTATGTDDATAEAVTAAPLEIVAVDADTPDLFPGAPGDVTLTVQNPNPYAVRLTSYRIGTVTPQGPGCAGYVAATVADAVALDPADYIDLAASSAAVEVTLDGAVTMATTAVDACQGLDFTVVVTLSGSQVV